MSNYISLTDGLGINSKFLTDKKQQTDYKIEYVTKYILQWAIISAERKDITDINFIDCMCNAGIYKDGDLCTGLEVLLSFNEIAKKHPEKRFNLFLNDYDKNKIDILKKLSQHFVPDKNVYVKVSNLDVNDYLTQISKNHSVFGYGKSTVLYVDPYNFGTVKIPVLKEAISNNYCELIFNFFISDYIRNWESSNEKIAACIGNDNINSKDELINYMRTQLKVGHMKYYFSYQFKTQNNVELYHIIFVTPNIRGLEVLKDTLWDVFNGEFYHRNKSIGEEMQMSLFTVDMKKEWLLEMHSKEARTLLLQHKGEVLSFNAIEEIIIENSMLKRSQIINNVLKPLMSDGSIVKMNTTKTRANYKNDSYRVV